MEALQLLLQALRGHNRRHLLLFLIRFDVKTGGGWAGVERARRVVEGVRVGVESSRVNKATRDGAWRQYHVAKSGLVW